MFYFLIAYRGFRKQDSKKQVVYFLFTLNAAIKNDIGIEIVNLE